MKWLSVLLPLAFFAACTPTGDRHASLHVKESQRIFGGDKVEVQAGNELTVAMITLDDEAGQSFVCTGTFISQRLILTASHCVTENKNQMRVLFGAAPFEGGAFVDVPIVDVHVYHKIVADESKAQASRHDVALIEIQELPAGAKLASLPVSSIERSTRLKFVALGYGRTSGLDLEGSDAGGAGVLRRVDLETSDYIEKEPTFSILQQDGVRGVCFGDSGGPALVDSVIVGVASGVMDLADTDPYALGYDACKQRSIYMNVAPYVDWIQSTSRRIELLRPDLKQAQPKS